VNFPLAPAEADASCVDRAVAARAAAVENAANRRSFALQICRVAIHSGLWIPSR
jgi:hypothetical protein